MKSNLMFTALLILFVGCEKPETNNPLPNNIGNPASQIDITYGSHPLQSMKLHLPENHNTSTKVVIMVHGGGWVMGYHPDEEVTTFSGRYGWDILNPLLDEGYACAVMKYRTACYNTVPDNFTESNTFYQDQMMEDIDLVIDHLKDNASNYEIANNHFQLLGESGGGHIVLTYGIRAQADEALKSVASMFGPVTLDDNSWKQYLSSLPLAFVEPPNYFLKHSDNCESVTNKQVKTFWSLKSFASNADIKVNEENEFLFPLCPHREENIKNDTPAFIMQGADDTLVPSFHADAMMDALENKYGSSNCAADDFDCNFKKKVYEKCGHGWTGGNCAKSEVMDDIVAWFKNH